jgi:hypothetical protein
MAPEPPPRVAAGGPLPRAAERPAAFHDSQAAAAVAFTAELRATKAFLSACLAEAKPTRVAGGAVEVWFPAEHTFHLHAVQDAIKTREIEPYLKVFFGQTLKLVVASGAEPSQIVAAGGGLPLTLDGGSEFETPGRAANGSARLTPDDIARSRRGAIDDVVQEHPRIEDIIDAFDGEVLEDRDS